MISPNIKCGAYTKDYVDINIWGNPSISFYGETDGTYSLFFWGKVDGRRRKYIPIIIGVDEL